MERVNRILEHDGYQECLRKNEAAEKDRRFCRHDMAHFLDVARIAWILNLQEEAGVEQEFIYAAALLHDCGRWRQYEDGTPHEKASAQIAPQILVECGFAEEEQESVLVAIREHRNPKSAETAGLTGLLYRADKLSRSCFSCKAKAECDWPEEKKNRKIRL